MALKWLVLSVGTVGLLCVASCGSEKPTLDVHINDSSIQGCRKPGDPGCATCCRVPDSPSTMPFCLSWTGSSMPNTKPWFNAAGPCPATISNDDCAAPCARCLETDEELLRSLAAEAAACRCDEVAPSVDPCFSAGCPCTCERYKGAKALCSDG